MTLVEGVGDEVIQFVGVVLLVVVAALAWWSTNAQPGRYRTVLVMRSRAYHPVSVSIRTSSRQISIANTPPEIPLPSELDTSENMSTESVEEVSSDNATVIPLQEMDSIVDADMAMMDNNRLHFYRRVGVSRDSANNAADSSDEESGDAASSSAQVREMERIVSAMEAIDDFTTTGNNSNASRVTAKSTEKDDKKENKPSASHRNIDENNTNTDDKSVVPATSEPEEAERRKIHIKLKYLNETLKEVEGSLDELLKDFKWRHFSTELSTECRVRLIFQGRALLDDGATLRACGLHDRAVVHCLVHPAQPRPAQTRRTGGTAGTGATGAEATATADAAPERAWDLDNILMTLVSVALTVVWFFRCEYSNMFTASASVALFGLTVFYSVAIFGLYLSDTFHFDRRAPQPAANN